MSNSQVFVEYYNKIDDFLTRTEGSDLRKPFTDKVFDSKNVIVEKYKYELVSFGRLRNAIVHDPRMGERVIAEPHDDIVQQIKYIYEQLSEPKTVEDFFIKKVTCLQEQETLASALFKMKEHAFSQLPILNEKKEVIELLSTNTIARWLALPATKKDLLDFEKVKVHDLLDDIEFPHNYRFIKKETTIYEAYDSFFRYADNEKTNLDALLISDFKTKTLLGLITIEDITIEMEKQFQIS